MSLHGAKENGYLFWRLWRSKCENRANEGYLEGTRRKSAGFGTMFADISFSCVKVFDGEWEIWAPAVSCSAQALCLPADDCRTRVTQESGCLSPSPCAFACVFH